MSELEDLFTKYGTDKGIWGYTPAYEKHLNRAKVKRVLEIGICGFRDIPNNVVGASLFAWRDYFTEAHIFGIDNDSRFIFNDHPYIHTALCDAYDVVQLADVIGAWGHPTFDFICDDAVHDPFPQALLVSMLWPRLNPGGIYAIEETCPYKLPNSDVRGMAALLLSMYPDMLITEYQTHKPERLLILQKPV